MAAQSYFDNIVNRNRLFYCSHMNRKNAFFQKHILNAKMTTKQISYKIVQDMFGFNRLRKETKENVLKMVQTVVKNQKKFDYNYYLSKNCPLPENWKERKQELLEKAARGGVDRASVFKELYEAESSTR